MMLNPVEAVFQSVAEFYRRVYWQAPNATTIWADNYTLSYSGVAWLHSVNHLWLHNPYALLAESDADALLVEPLQAAKRFFAQYSADYNIVFSEPGTLRADEQLGAFGYAERLRNPILVLDRPPRVAHLNRQARIIRVTEATK